MNPIRKSITRHPHRPFPSLSRLWLLATAAWLTAQETSAAPAPTAHVVTVRLSEWSVELTPARVPAGPATFEVINAGSIPHALEVEGKGLEKSTPEIKPGATTTLALTLGAGKYEVYCPIGKGSHKMLGMMSDLTVATVRASATKVPVAGATAAKSAGESAAAEADEATEYAHDAAAGGDEDHAAMHHAAGGTVSGRPKTMTVTGGGTVIQILPGPFPFADSAQRVIAERPADQMADLTKKAHMGPYSNNVAPITGDISLIAIDRGATRDSVSGTAHFVTQDSARWTMVMDRVQTKDIPFNPRFGGVIMGLFYHGASGVHTPLVPTIQSSLALWAYAHMYRNDKLVTDDAMVHIMLLSRTRRTSDWALDCWDCSSRPIEELQLQITPPPGAAPFDAPGGFLFVNWEKSNGQSASN